MRLSGKRALVTGGSRGIGARIADFLARDGADVAITYERSADKAKEVCAIVEGYGGRAISVQADSADSVAVRRSVDEVASALGGLDILVNNAGIFRYGPLDTFTIEDLDATLNVNIRSAVIASQAAGHHLSGGGRIINIGSCLAERVTVPGLAVYSMSKAALIGLTQGLARELGPRGITVNIVHPGPTDTDMSPANGEQPEVQRLLKAVGGYGSVDDIAAAVAFLVGPEAKHITGAGLTVDGGLNA